MLETRLVRCSLLDDAAWAATFKEAESGRAGLHLAIFEEPYLSYILEGKKTIESRFGVQRTPPFGRVERGDVILLKATSGPVVGIAQAANVWSYRLGVNEWREIRERFGPGLCLENEPDFVAQRSRSRYATLIRLANVRRLSPVAVTKRDRRGWVVLRDAGAPPAFPGFEAFA